MFLSQKNAIYFNKPKHTNPLKPKRVLPGWEDDDEEKPDKYEFSTQKGEQKAPLNDLLEGDEFADVTPEPSKKDNNQKFYFDWDQLNEKEDIECEKKLVEDIVAPGGIRIKPNDTMLSEFLKEVKGMEIHIIGSLLLSKIQVNYPFQTKAKALYTIEYLVKKNDVYLSYFKAHAHKLTQFPEPEDNVENYRKILKTLLNFIGLTQSQPSNQPQIKPTFVDPGYNDDPKSQMSNFIQGNTTTNKPKKTQNKKVIIGPGMNKQKPPVEPPGQPNNDLMGLDLLGGSNPSQKPTAPIIQNTQGQMSFEDMLGGINFNGSTNFQANTSNGNASNSFLI